MRRNLGLASKCCSIQRLIVFHHLWLKIVKENISSQKASVPQQGYKHFAIKYKSMGISVLEEKMCCVVCENEIYFNNRIQCVFHHSHHHH